MTPNEIAAQVRSELDASGFFAEGEEYLDCAVALFMSASVGPSIKKLAKLLRLPRRKVARWSKHWRHSGVWRWHYVYPGPWIEEDKGILALLLDTMVGMGEVVREKTRDGKDGYAAALRLTSGKSSATLSA